MNWFQMSFIPRNSDVALLVLRVAFSLQMIYAHGWDKLKNFEQQSATFHDPLGIGSGASISLAIVGELLCAAFVVLGLFTRPAAVGLMLTMGVAFFMIHGARLVGRDSGEMALLYLVAYLTIFIAGPGRYSVDNRLS